MDLIRRLPKTILVTALALLLLGGTTGLVVAAGQPEMPRTLSVPAQQVGDRWQYEIRVEVTAPGENLSERVLATYEWMPAEALLGADGKWRATHPLVEQVGMGEDALVSEYLVDAAGRDVVATRDRGEFWATGNGFGALAGVPLREESTQERNEHLMLRFEEIPLYCGYVSQLQEGPVPLSRPVQFGGMCDLSGLMEGRGGSAGLRATGVDDVGGTQAVRFEGTSRFEELSFDLSIWMAPHIPYPVRSAYALHAEVEGVLFDVTLDVALTGFAPGNGGWGGLELPTRAPAPIHLSQMRPWGPDDNGVILPFLAREAWHVAMEDEEAGEWLAGRPDAAAVSGEYSQVRFEDRVERTWTLLVASSRGPANIEVTRTEWDAATPYGLLMDATQEEHQVVLSPSEEPVPVAREQLVPTVRSVQQRWSTMSGDEANAYGFFYCSDCPEAGIRVTGGHVDGSDTTPSVSNPAEPVTGEYEEARNLLIVGPDGRPEAIQSSLREGSRHQSPLVGGGMDVQSGGPVETAAPLSMASVPWSLPAAPAASVAAGALLVGLVYWLWPVLKSGGMMGLFSRVRRDEMLENPGRRLILDAIQANPGIHYQQLIRTVGKGRGTVEHHVRKLQEGGYVVSHRNAGHTCFFVKGTVDHSVMAAVPAIRTGGAARVLDHVQRHPGTRVGAVADALGIARSTASHHVRRLREAGLIEEAAGLLMPTRLAQPALAAVAA